MSIMKQFSVFIDIFHIKAVSEVLPIGESPNFEDGANLNQPIPFKLLIAIETHKNRCVRN